MIEKVTLNLPGTNTYDPSMPWVYKVGWDSKIVADLYFYIYMMKDTLLALLKIVGELRREFVSCLVIW